MPWFRSCHRSPYSGDTIAARAKLDDRQVPRDHHWHGPPLPGFERKANGNGSGEILATADPVFAVASENSIPRERLPDPLAVVFRVEGGEVRHFDAGRFKRSDDELAIPLVFYCSKTIAVEHQAPHDAGGALWFAGKAIPIPVIPAAAQIARERVEPSQHVRP
jgi:hypothetical protein